MKIEKRSGLKTWAKTKVCNRPVTTAAPAVVVRSKKNGIEMSRRAISGLSAGKRQALVEQNARRRGPGETLCPFAPGSRHAGAQAAVVCQRTHVARQRIVVIHADAQTCVAAHLDQSRLIADDGRAADMHGLRRGQAEALVTRREYQRQRVFVERAQF